MEFNSSSEEMTPLQLNKCLQKFYLSARRQDGTFYNETSLTAIRAALDQHLKSLPLNKPFSIIRDPLKESSSSLTSLILENTTNRMVLYLPFPRQNRQGKPAYHEENHACLEENTSWRRIEVHVLRSEQRARSCVGY